jgi:hypothetical protein
MASTFGLLHQTELDIVTALCRRKSLGEKNRENVVKITKQYFLLQEFYISYMTFCLVYEEVQKKLINENENNSVTNQILRNAVILVQGLRFVENGERFSPDDDKNDGNRRDKSQHALGYTGFGVDDFTSKEKTTTSIFDWIEEESEIDEPSIHFVNVETLSRVMNEKYNELKGKFRQLKIERHMVTFESIQAGKKTFPTLATNIFTPMYHFSEGKKNNSSVGQYISLEGLFRK